MKKSYQYILLDWDGNIARTLDLWVKACQEVLAKRGIELSIPEIVDGFGDVELHMRNVWGVPDTEKAIEEAIKYVTAKLPEVELYPDALEVIERLSHAGKHLALITGSQHMHIEHLLDKYNLLQHFEVIIARDDVKHQKPHPEPLEKALKLLNGNKEEAVMIGDSNKDMGAALNTGVDSILFYPPEHTLFHDLEELKKLKPTYIIEDFREILDIV